MQMLLRGTSKTAKRVEVTHPKTEQKPLEPLKPLKPIQNGAWENYFSIFVFLHLFGAKFLGV